MKKLVLTAVTSFACLAAFAQGKIGFATDSLHLVYWASGAGTNTGNTVNSDSMAPGISGMGAFLYMGTSSSSLFLYSSTTFGALASGPGKWATMNVAANANTVTLAPAIPSGTVFVEVAILSTEKAAPNTFNPASFQTYAAYGTSAEFTFNLGTSVIYPTMTGPNSAGSWLAGTFALPQYGAGSMGAIGVSVPEPASLALAGLGAAALLIFRRRK